MSKFAVTVRAALLATAVAVPLTLSFSARADEASAASAAPAPVAAADAVHVEAARKVATQVCSSCHGGHGQSVSPEFPHLAGQQRDYLASQLRAFRTRTRADPDAHDYMWGMATMLDEKLIEPLADYYAAQVPPRGQPEADAALLARGDRLFHEGLPDRQVAPCAGCHGPDGKGQAIFPRLAGQHAGYLRKQILAIQDRLRDSPVMHGIVRELKPDEIAAVAAWLQGHDAP